MKNTKQRNIFIGIVGLVIVILGWTYLGAQDSKSDYEYEIRTLETTIDEHEETIKKYEDIIATSTSDLENLQVELRDVSSLADGISYIKIKFIMADSKDEVEDLARELESDVDDLQREIQEVESITDDTYYKLQNSDLQYSY